MHHALGEWEAAERHYIQCLKLEPNNQVVIANMKLLELKYHWVFLYVSPIKDKVDLYPSLKGYIFTVKNTHKNKIEALHTLSFVYIQMRALHILRSLW